MRECEDNVRGESDEERIDRLNAEARELFATSPAEERPRIRELALKALEESIALRYSLGRGHARVTLGEQCVSLLENEAALEHAADAVSALESTGDLRGLARALKLMGVIHRRMGRTEEARELYIRSLPLLESIGAFDDAAAMVNNIGLINWRLGNYTEAMEWFERALLMFRRLGDRRGEADVLNNIALIHRHRERYSESIRSLQQSLAIARDTGDRMRESTALDNLGVMYNEIGALDKAMEFGYQSLVIARELGNRREEIVALDNLGKIHQRLNDAEEAVEYHERALALSIEMGELRSRVLALFNLADLHRAMNRPERAEECYRAGIEVAAGTQEPELAILSHRRMAELHEMNGRHDAARESLAEMLALAERIDERRYTFDSLWRLGRVALLQGDAAASLEYLHRGLGMTGDDAPREMVEEYYRQLVETYRSTGDFERALDYHERYHALKSAMLNEESMKRIRNLQVVHDIEQIRKEAELQREHNTELARANALLRHANRLKSEMVAITAHDLRNPLLGIRMHMEQLLAHGGADNAGYFMLIHRSVGEMLAAVQNQLNLAAIESGELRIEPVEVRIAAVIDDVIAKNRMQLAAKEQRLELDVDNVVALGDRAGIHDIISNLFTNAMKFSPRGAAIAITVRRAERRAERVTIAVRDEGPGIAESQRSELFKRFKRLSSLPTDGESSTGLGLWIARKLAALHGGTVRLDATGPAGSTFIVELPAL